MSDLKVMWEPSGRPRLWEPTAPQAELSLAHDGDIGVAVVGHGPQGCDVQAVAQRSRLDWEALLGPERAANLDGLIAAGDTLDQSGTRLWAATEAGIKAHGAPALQSFRVVGREGAATLLEADHPDFGTWQVLTSLLSLEPGHDHMVAVGLESAPRTLPAVEAIDEPATEPATEPAAELAAEPTAERPPLKVPQRTAGFTQSFTVLVRDVPKALGTVHFPSFVSWMGASREEALRAITPQVERDLRDNKGKFVAGSLSLRCLAPARVSDRIAVVMSTSAPDWERGPYTFDWTFHKGDADGPRVAEGTMRAVWIAPEQPDVYRVTAPPRYLSEFLTTLSAERPVTRPGTEELLLGKQLTRRGAGKALARVVCDLRVTMEETDFQGHAHFVNYFRWQAIARDELLRSLGIDILSGSDVPTCLSTEMNFLREVRPFERIRVTAEVEAVHAGGLDTRMSILRLTEGGEVLDKVAAGRQRVALTTDAPDGTPLPGRLPTAALKALGLADVLELVSS